MKEKMSLLRDRLNDISRSNRSIRLLKLDHKWSFDISDMNNIGEDPSAILAQMLGKKAATLIDDANSEAAFLLSEKLQSLYRNLEAIEEETGLYDLYLGYPFISGSMKDGTYVRAPLFLYPVRLNRVKNSGNEWRVDPLDGSPELNRSLFLALQKLNDLHVSENTYEEAVGQAQHTGSERWTEWLRGCALNIRGSLDDALLPVQSYYNNEVPELNKGEFQLQHMAVLGHFPQGNSALLNDYDQFMEWMNKGEDDLGLVADLLNVNDRTEAVQSNNYCSESSGIYQDPLEKEKGKTLVLDTDASQEEIIDRLEEEKGMVVHGPPGTGKSQVIVNIISNAIAKNKKVMVVTQKRAALDVVYQRLDALGLSANTALLHDKKNDRTTLYRKLHHRLSNNNSYEVVEQAFLHVSEKIVQTEEKLNEVARNLFEEQEHGYRAYDLYGRSRKLNEQEDMLKLQSVLHELNKDNLDDVLMKVVAYGNYYSRFGYEDSPLSGRKPFTHLRTKDQVNIIEILEKAIGEAEQSMICLEHFDKITPGYSWRYSDKLEKIYRDLEIEEKYTFKDFRFWWWATFTGKAIVNELTEKKKLSWQKLKQRVHNLYDLSHVSKQLFHRLEELNPYLSDSVIHQFKQQVEQGDIPYALLKKLVKYMKQDFEDLRNMDRLYEESPDFLKKILDELKARGVESSVEDLGSYWKDLTEQSICNYWIDAIERKNPELIKISITDFEYERNHLKELLEEKRQLSIKLIRQRMEQTVQKVKESNSKAIKDLTYQTGKKRSVWPVRKLVNTFALDGLLDVMPVWLVSPETVSAIFPLEKEMFDFVIFDEASQCTLENGLPAVYRAKKVVIAGDEKQLPPSVLFKASTGAENGEGQDDADESESLLNLAKRVLPSKLLEWHYRSKSEELINFSNHAFYNGDMQIAPNVDYMQNPACIQWHKVDGRWMNQHNRIEAEAVVDLLKDTLLQNISKSIGIITFNAKQQETIENMMEKRAAEDSEFGVVYEEVMARHLDERIFVKNIENVQGDERDIIIFSIAYAKNEKDKVYSRFGSLGQQGGENRLNVAVTRAKEEIHLVSSIEPYELEVADTKHNGPQLLKNYLAYGQAVSQVNKENIKAVLSGLNEEMNMEKQKIDNEFDSAFEKEVYEQLKDMGYELDVQIGTSGYRIDMAVVHPNDPHRYILGIECDSTVYHIAPSAKERDVYRQRFLESKGWTIFRIWSRGWWKNASAELEKVDHLIKQMVQSEQEKKEVF